MTRNSAEQQLQVLAVERCILRHTAAALYDGWALYRHIQSLKDFKESSCEQYSPV